MKRFAKIIAPSLVAAFVAAFVMVNANTLVLANHDYEGEHTPTPSASVSPSPIVSPTPSASASPTATPSISPTPSASVSPSSTPTATPSPAPCIATDVHGNLIYSGNHLSGDPVGGSFYNIAENADCSDTVYIMAYGSKQEPEAVGWLQSQVFVSSQTYTIPQGSSDFTIQFDVPNGDFCWYQVDAVRTSEVRIPPTYAGVDMIDYVFVKDADSCNPATPTPTPTTGGNTNINNNENKQEQTQTQTNNQTVNVTVNQATSSGQVLSGKTIAKQPETGVGVLGFATMFSSAPLGLFLAKFKRGKAAAKKMSAGEFASDVFESRIQKQTDLS